MVQTNSTKMTATLSAPNRTLIELADENPALDIDWRAARTFSFPTSRKSALLVPWAASEQCSGQFLKNMGAQACSMPLETLGITEFIHQKYCVPHAKAISDRGRHLLCIKLYGAKYQAMFYFMPREMVHTQYGSVAKCREKELENYPNLVDSYPLDSAIAVHVEMFAQQGGTAQRRIYVGGFCLHQPDWSNPISVERHIDFANCSEIELDQMAKKREKARLKRAKQRCKKKEHKSELQRASKVDVEEGHGMLLRIGVEHSSDQESQVRALSDERCADFEHLLAELKMEDATALENNKSAR